MLHEAQHKDVEYVRDLAIASAVTGAIGAGFSVSPFLEANVRIDDLAWVAHQIFVTHNRSASASTAKH